MFGDKKLKTTTKKKSKKKALLLEILVTQYSPSYSTVSNLSSYLATPSTHFKGLSDNDCKLYSVSLFSRALLVCWVSALLSSSCSTLHCDGSGHFVEKSHAVVWILLG